MVLGESNQFYKAALKIIIIIIIIGRFAIMIDLLLFTASTKLMFLISDSI